MGKAKSLLELLAAAGKSRKAVSRLPRPKSLAASLGLDEVALKKSGLLLPPAEDKVRLFRVQSSGEPAAVPSWMTTHPDWIQSQKSRGRWFHEDPRLTDWYSNRFRPPEVDITAPHELTFTDFARGPHEQYRVSNMPRARLNSDIVDNPRSFSASGMSEHEFFLPRGGFDLGGQIGLEGIDMDQTKALLEHLSKQKGVRIKPKAAGSLYIDDVDEYLDSPAFGRLK
tara:strand:+ start:374 stop:1051 length:678 start_codon:yes stop_codon:yes gene_type:complete